MNSLWIFKRSFTVMAGSLPAQYRWPGSQCFGLI